MSYPDDLCNNIKDASIEEWQVEHTQRRFLRVLAVRKLDR
jgi:hypothetical protein